MKAFYRWWKKASQGGINEYHAYEGWKAALRWVKSRSECSKELYMIWANDIDEELKE